MISPVFYSKFYCIASRCVHSCCRGWEIDVDSDTADYYNEIEGELGRKLRDNLVYDSDEYHFRLTQDERCPFLKQDGLCEVILNLGEEALCDICALHPRFFFTSERILVSDEANGPADTFDQEIEFGGLGLSCEEVTRLLLSEDGVLLFEDDTGDRYTIDSILDMLGYESEKGYSFKPYPDRSKYEIILRLFSETEPIDKFWTEMIDSYLRSTDEIVEKCREALPGFDSIRFQRIHDYILYRQLDRLYDTGLSTIEHYADLCCEFIFICSIMTGDLPESVRRFSEQIEYSTENVDILMND